MSKMPNWLFAFIVYIGIMIAGILIVCTAPWSLLVAVAVAVYYVCYMLAEDIRGDW